MSRGSSSELSESLSAAPERLKKYEIKEHKSWSVFNADTVLPLFINLIMTSGFDSDDTTPVDSTSSPVDSGVAAVSEKGSRCKDRNWILVLETNPKSEQEEEKPKFDSFSSFSTQQHQHQKRENFENEDVSWLLFLKRIEFLVLVKCLDAIVQTWLLIHSSMGGVKRVLKENFVKKHVFGEIERADMVVLMR